MFRKTLLACAISMGSAHVAEAEEMEAPPVEFDRETLQSLGVDPDISRYFAQKAKFLPGKQSVSLRINGQNAGSVVATFDNDGQLCFDRSFMEQSGVRLPSDYQDGCYDYLAAYPDAVIALAPVQERVELVLRQDQLVQESMALNDYSTGGAAGLLNYSLLASRNEFTGGRSDYSQLMLNGGFNINDWLFRSSQLISRSAGKLNSENSQNYLQHTFVDVKTTMKAGEVSLSNRLLEGGNIYGIELLSENALSMNTNGAQVSGIANTPQARVEIHQQGVLVYSTLVPAGYFTLADIPLRNMTSDLNVTVVETDGSQYSYSVPSSLYNRNPGSPAGFTFSLGRVSDSYSEKPWVASLSGGKRLGLSHNLNAGIIAAQDYQAAAVGVDSALLPQTSLSLMANQSFDRRNSLQGQKYQLNLNTAAPLNIGVSASVTQKSVNYRDFTQVISSNDAGHNKYEYSMGISWGSPLLGSFSSSFYETQPFNDGERSRFAMLGWGKSFESFSVSTSWQRQLSGGGDRSTNQDLFNITLSVPFGERSVNLYARQNKGDNRYGASTTGRATENTFYTLSTERNEQQKENNFSGGIFSNLHYSQLSLNATTNGQNSRSYSGTLQGGITAHRDGVTFSPLSVKETFAIAQLDKPVSGVRLDTPQGPVWTDFRGQAVIPSVTAWKTSRIELRTDSLPKNMDVGNGIRQLRQSKGAVGKVQFDILTQRRVLLAVTMGNGKPLPKGAPITDSEGNYLTTSVDDGVVFLNDIPEAQPLIAQLEEGNCKLKFTLSEEASTDSFYENASGICQ